MIDTLVRSGRRSSLVPSENEPARHNAVVMPVISGIHDID